MTTAPGAPRRTAVIGTGQIGAMLARRLASYGEVTAFDTVPDRVAGLLPHGVSEASTARDAAHGVEVVLVCVLDDGDLREACAGPDGLLAGVEPGTLVIALPTIGAETAEWFEREVTAVAARPAVAPFFGSVAEAEAGGLWFVLGCSVQDVDDAERALEPLAAAVHHAGGLHQATALKLATNVLVFPMVQLIGEAVEFCRALGLDPRQLLDLIRDGTGVRAPLYQVKGAQIVDNDYAPRASVELAAKDLKLILSTAEQQGLSLPLTALTADRFRVAVDEGLAHEDMAAVAKLLAVAKTT